MKMFSLVFFLVLVENISGFFFLFFSFCNFEVIQNSFPSLSVFTKGNGKCIICTHLRNLGGGIQEHKEFFYPFYTSEVCLVTS